MARIEPTRKSTGNRLTVSMIVRNEAHRYLAHVIGHAASYADAFVIIDDASTDDTVAVCRMAVGNRPLTLIENPKSMFSQESALRALQWTLTMSTCPDWVLFLDADEIFEDAILDEIRSLIDQDVHDVVGFRLFDMWDLDHYRDDALWCSHRFHRPFLVRNLPSFRARFPPRAQHCGRVPLNVIDLPHTLSNIRIKHLGWMAPGDRRTKYERYMALDPDARFGSAAQYLSILDPSPNVTRFEAA